MCPDDRLVLNFQEQDIETWRSDGQLVTFLTLVLRCRLLTKVER